MRFTSVRVGRSSIGRDIVSANSRNAMCCVSGIGGSAVYTQHIYYVRTAQVSPTLRPRAETATRNAGAGGGVHVLPHNHDDEWIGCSARSTRTSACEWARNKFMLNPYRKPRIRDRHTFRFSISFRVNLIKPHSLHNAQVKMQILPLQHACVRFPLADPAELYIQSSGGLMHPQN